MHPSRTQARTSASRLLLIAFALAAAGCDTGGPTETTMTPSLGEVSVPGCVMQSPGHFWASSSRWTCGTAVTIGAPTELQTAAAQAAAIWNTAMGHGANGTPQSVFAPGLPRFVPTSGATGLLVIQWGSGGGLPYCGGTEASSASVDVMTIERGSECDSYSNKSDDLVAVLVHEMGHSLGFDNDLHKAPSQSNCAMHLESIAPAINSTVCQHELEWLLAGYNYRPSPPGSFWTQPIATRILGIPPTATIQQGSAITITATALAFDRQNGAGNQPIGSSGIEWEADDDGVAVVAAQSDSSVSVTGGSVGATTVRAQHVGTLPLNAQASARLLNVGEPTAVTVTSPPGAFRVSNITGPSTPITIAGNYPLQAVVVNAPGSPVQIRWVVIYSNGDSLDTGYLTGTTRTIQVYDGSYNIRVKAYPRVGTTYGLHSTRKWPVCTGGDDLLQFGGGGPDAVEGC